MNLKDALDYRRNCIIHGMPMKAFVYEFRFGLKVRDNSLLVMSRKDQCLLRFGFDGSFVRTSDCPKNITNTLTICMMCEECAKVPILKPRALGATTLQNILYVQHYYTMFLTGGSDSKYTVGLEQEEVKYHTNDKFYHVGVNLQTKKATCTMGSCNLGYKFDDILRGLSIIEIPTFNIEKIQNIEQYVDKLKLYNLFS